MATTAFPVRARRVLSWHRRKIAAVLVGVAVLIAVRSATSDGPPTQPVLVTAHPVAAGHVVTAADLSVRRLPVQSLPTAPLETPSEAIGRLSSAALPAGQVLTDLALVSERQAGPGRVIAPLRLADAALAALLRPGESVDVVSNDPQTGAATVVASDVRVVTIPSAAADGGGPLGSSAGSVSAGVLVLVSVPATDAVTLAGAATGQLSVVWAGQ